jgi:mono/diheme cytochrome c family protein
MKNNRIKLLVIALITLPMIALMILNTNNVRAGSGATLAVTTATEDDVAASYKKQCAMCHTAKADKFFDPAKTDEVLIETVLKGRKGEKPPYMPGYEAKGMTSDQAKLLVGYMKQLRTPPSE